jgi:hypothetical protein
MKKNDFLKIRANTIRPLQLWGIEFWIYLSVGFGKLNLDECISCLQNRLLSFSSCTELVAENSNSWVEFRVQR